MKEIQLIVDGTGSKLIGNNVQPGAVYEVHIKLTNKRASSNPNPLTVTFEYAGSGGRMTIYDGSVPQYGVVELTTKFVMPMDAYRLKWKVDTGINSASMTCKRA